MLDPILTVATLQIRDMARGWKVPVLGLLLVGAAALSFSVRKFAPDPDGAWPQVFLLMVVFLFLQTQVILFPLLFMTSLIRDEVEEGTAVYLFTRPVPKALVLGAKFVAATLFVAGLLTLGLLLFHASFQIAGGGGVPDFDWTKRIFHAVLAICVGTFAYGAIFTLVSLVSRRALIWGIAYGFISEFVLTNIPAFIRELTVMYYLRAITFGGVTGLGDREADQFLEFLEMPSTGSAALTLSIVGFVLLGISCAVVTFQEFHGKRVSAEAL